MQRNRWFGYQINYHLLRVLTQAPSKKCGGKSKQLEMAAFIYSPLVAHLLLPEIACTIMHAASERKCTR
jgi:hypothetical protein